MQKPRPGKRPGCGNRVPAVSDLERVFGNIHPLIRATLSDGSPPLVYGDVRLNTSGSAGKTTMKIPRHRCRGAWGKMGRVGLEPTT